MISSLSGAGSRRVDILAEDDRAAGAWRRELNHAKVFTIVVVGVESPPKLPIELLRAVHIRDGDNDDFELHVDSRLAGVVSLDIIRRILPFLVTGETSINGILCTLAENRCNVLNSLAG